MFTDRTDQASKISTFRTCANSPETSGFSERKHLRAVGFRIDAWHHAAQWFAVRAIEHNQDDHAEWLFVVQVLRVRETVCLDRAQKLADALETGSVLSTQELVVEYRKLATLFECELISFERKRYTKLLHEPNKAMNLNCYIHLNGKYYAERRREQGLWLDEYDPQNATLCVPAARYFITLDADSILLPEYALRLSHIMEQPGNERIAVAQTPYSAFPGSESTLERVAGTTTDIQYLHSSGIHSPQRDLLGQCQRRLVFQ